MKIRSYIKDANQAENIICSICLDICTKPVKCCGPCSTLYCLKCISEWRMKNQKCPMRCNKKEMTIQLLNDFVLNFFCPFDKQHCEIPIRSKKQFQNHYKHCKQINQEQQKKLQYKNQFKCDQGHQLQFFIGSYQQMCKKICSNCEDEKLCRATCRQCSEFYCVDCRKTPCSKKSCPIGHSFRFLPKSGLGYICDNCGGSISLLKCGVYDDGLCNFGICEKCYQILPQQLQNNVKQNKPQFCNKNHPLSYLQQAKITNCSMCKKEVPCPKYCKTCNTRYCFRCKIPSIGTNKKCQQKHLYVQKHSLPLKMCQMCFSQDNESYYEDQTCKILLCEDCFNYCLKVNSDKQRFLKYIKCKKSHLLHYFSGEMVRYKCSLCKNNMPIKLFCNMCKQLNCVKCLPPPQQNKCYLGHDLESGKLTTCLICSNQDQNESSVKCERCAYEVCQKCHENMFKK